MISARYRVRQNFLCGCPTKCGDNPRHEKVQVRAKLPMASFKLIYFDDSVTTRTTVTHQQRSLAGSVQAKKEEALFLRT